MDLENFNYQNNAGLKLIIEQLMLEVRDVSEENFDKWYEKKRKVFNTGIKNFPTREEFIKYLNYALTIAS